MSEERIQMVIKPAVMKSGEKHEVSHCGSIDGAAKIQLGIPVSQLAKNLKQAGGDSGYIVVEFELNAAYFSKVPIKSGGTGLDDYEKGIRRDNLLNRVVDIELRSNEEPGDD